VNIDSPQDTANASNKSGRVMGKRPDGAVQSPGCVTARRFAGESGLEHAPVAAARPNGATRLMGIWRLGQQIGAGSHSVLSAAQPADSVGNTRWDYVIRSIPQTADRGEAIEQLRRFNAAAAVARHPHLIAVLDSSLDGAEPFLVMPRLANRSLADVLASGTIQPLPVVLWLVRQTAEAAAALHHSGFVHGDIKPENVLLSPRGHATLIDLGFARRSGELPDGVFRGSSDFAAPELIDAAAAVSPAADGFALGRLLWQLLSLTDRSATTAAGIDAVADLIAELVDADPKRRPTAEKVASRLIRLEIETLGCHIRPSRPVGQTGRSMAKPGRSIDQQRAA